MSGDQPDPAAIVQQVEQLLGVRLEPWQAGVLRAFYERGQHVSVTHGMRRADWVTSKLLIHFAQMIERHDAHRRAAWQLSADIAGRETKDGMLSQAWVTARLEHLARYGCPGPQDGRTCIHDDSQAWSP